MALRMVPNTNGKKKYWAFLEPKDVGYTTLQSDMLFDLMMAYRGCVFITYVGANSRRLIFLILNKKDLSKLEDFKFLYGAIISSYMDTRNIKIEQLWL